MFTSTNVQLPEYIDSLQDKYQKNWTVRNSIEIPKQAIFVANHPHLHEYDWIPAECIPQEWGQNEFDYSFIHVPTVRSILLYKLCPSIQTVVKPIGYRRLMEWLNCIHLPESNGYIFLENQINQGQKLLLFPEGGCNTGRVHTSFAALAASFNIPVIFLKFSDTISLQLPSKLEVRNSSFIEDIPHGVSLFTQFCLD